MGERRELLNVGRPLRLRYPAWCIYCQETAEPGEEAVPLLRGSGRAPSYVHALHQMPAHGQLVCTGCWRAPTYRRVWSRNFKRKHRELVCRCKGAGRG